MENFVALILFAVHCYSAVISNSTTSSVLKDPYKLKSTLKVVVKTKLLEIEENEVTVEVNVTKTRFKRQSSSGASKFTHAANMPQIKLLRLFLTMFKNLWAPSYVGGSHPFHPYVPKPIVKLFKHRIVDFFFPDVGVDALKNR